MLVCVWSRGSPLHEQFKEEFAPLSLHATLAAFAEAAPLAHLLAPTRPRTEHALLIRALTWLLQRNGLAQLHTFVYLVVAAGRNEHLRMAHGSIAYKEDTIAYGMYKIANITYYRDTIAYKKGTVS